MHKPNFLICGFAKSGTTSLYHYLSEHPEIYLPKRKELHYFTRKILSNKESGPGDKLMQKFHVRNKEKYYKFFEGAQHKAIGEVSPTYALYDEAVEEIEEQLGKDIKIILILRDPIKRAFSNYQHLKRENRETLSFQNALELEDERFLDKNYANFWRYRFSSDYLQHVDRIVNRFNNVKIIILENFQNNKEDEYREILDFLGVSSVIPKNLHTSFNEGGIYKRNILTKILLERNFINYILKSIIPLNQRTKKIVGNLLNMFTSKSSEKISKETEDYLIRKLSENTKILARKYNLDISLWNQKFQK